MCRPRVLIAGAGVAGLETLLALHALAPDTFDITIVSPERKFVNRSMAVDQPFRPQRVRGVRLHETAARFGARWHRGTLDRVEPARRRVITRDRDELPYDVLVLCLGAHSCHEWDPVDALTYHDGRDGPHYRMLLQHMRDGRVRTVTFVKPSGTSWLLPLYDLALLTAADCRAYQRPDIELALITHEAEPLGVFGRVASAAIRELLDESRVRLHTGSYAVPAGPGRLEISPGGRGMIVDRVVSEPRLVGPRPRGVPCDREGFIDTDAHGRLAGLDGLFAAGDATSFPVKHGAVAAQQADAVAETIAASAGVDIDPQPFRPILRGLVLTGGRPRFLRADISGGAGDDSRVSDEPLWWPPNKLSARYLAPFLSDQVGSAADVMAQHS